ncbi:MAG: hypothetical protein KA314_05005 [Chloroflexi bacterium]|nr:hypothetical protein [Chloroflexota bacterium]
MQLGTFIGRERGGGRVTAGCAKRGNWAVLWAGVHGIKTPQSNIEKRGRKTAFYIWSAYHQTVHTL